MKCVICGNPIPNSRLKRGSNTCGADCRKEYVKQYHKQYRRDNAEAIAEQKKRYYEANKDKFKQYYEANKDKIAVQQKQYREANKDKIAEQKKQRYEGAYIKLSKRSQISVDDLKAFVPPMFIERELDCWEIGKSYFLDFVCFVNERAGGRCELTGKKSSNREVHHLNGYNWCIEGRVDPTNAICIDKAVHKAFHQIYGYGDNTAEQWFEFASNYMKKPVTLDDWK